ncbi:MAG: hypothetical protein JST33_04395 [Actinobacteria bacterium]|nr:hypothetical protein [Actinomycetota bacterium]
MSADASDGMAPPQNPARAGNSGSGGGFEADPPPEREISSRRGEARTPGAEDDRDGAEPVDCTAPPVTCVSKAFIVLDLPNQTGPIFPDLYGGLRDAGPEPGAEGTAHLDAEGRVASCTVAPGTHRLRSRIAAASAGSARASSTTSGPTTARPSSPATF